MFIVAASVNNKRQHRTAFALAKGCARTLAPRRAGEPRGARDRRWPAQPLPPLPFSRSLRAMPYGKPDALRRYVRAHVTRGGHPPDNCFKVPKKR